MDKHALLAAVAQIMPLCNKPEQMAFLNNLTESSPEAFEGIVKSIASTVNPNDIGRWWSPSLLTSTPPCARALSNRHSALTIF